ncbi:hypothetical protein [Herpetosiphon gulosus]|uniref:Uncharacterized protein n=1 Tax=Herpetosiphon gulosus TaxID=1973496 RepID=A0ABP9X6B3_9CHLR
MHIRRMLVNTICGVGLLFSATVLGSHAEEVSQNLALAGRFYGGAFVNKGLSEITSGAQATIEAATTPHDISVNGTLTSTNASGLAVSCAYSASAKAVMNKTIEGKCTLRDQFPTIFYSATSDATLSIKGKNTLTLRDKVTK